VYGRTSDGEFGVRYQSRKFSEFGLKATFFTEALSADVIGRRPIEDVVRHIHHRGHEVQLHVHTEWLGDISVPGLPGEYRQNLGHFSLEEQTRIIARGIRNLRRCGGRDIVALRAGNCGANLDTLRAASANGLLFDSSYNRPQIGAACDLQALGELIAPKCVEGVVEVPVSYFSDYPGHFRPVQLCACSFSEIREALLWAWRDRWSTFVFMMHSFELIKHGPRSSEPAAPHLIHLARFEKLCRFLAANRDKFRTVLFRDFAAPQRLPGSSPRPMRSRLHRTLHRYAEQAISRLA
jgi:peptidoglycan/xylan/chitin deacetylase (PgdA/CDA1 family)